MSTATVPAIIMRAAYASDVAYRAAIQTCLAVCANAGKPAKAIDKGEGVIWIVLTKVTPEPAEPQPLAWNETHEG